MKKVMFLISITIICLFMSAGALADPPANDDCADATDAGMLVADSTVVLSGSLVDATYDCERSSYPEVWVKFTVGSCMDVTIDFCDDVSGIESVSRYLFSLCPCDDRITRSSTSSCNNGNPSATWEGLEAGTYYYPIWTDIGNESFIVNITGTDCPAAPPYDDCANAIEIGEVEDYEFTTRSSTYDGSGSCITSGGNVWFVYTSSITDYVRIDLSDSDFNTIVAVYDGDNCSSLPLQIFCTGESQYDFQVVSGQRYLIEIGGENAEFGNGVLSIGELPEVPFNDECANADDGGTLYSGVTIQYTGTSYGATQECTNYNYPEVWISFTVESCMNITIDFCDDENSVQAVSERLHSDCTCSNYFYAGSMASCENNNPAYTFNNVQPGAYYYPILAYNSGGSYVVNVTGVDCPVGACCVGDGTTCYDGIQELDCINNYEGTWKGANSECGEQDPETGIYEGCQEEPNTGACCLDGGLDCIETDEETCYDEYEGDWMGYGTDCTDSDENEIADICEEPSTGACCYGDGDCIETDEDNCYGQYEGEWKGEGTDCTDADENEIADACEESDTYEYLPGDANMAAEAWPAQTIGGDVTYLVNYFRGLADPCYLDGFYASADATGDCMVVGGDVTYLVNYFRGLADMSYCSNYEPAWPTPSEVPTEAPDGWPNCD